ncbi:ATP-binding cassette domain-containing protein [Desulfovibrio desulfuricans]|uniref:ATP-binding cassette domain-containing protein n=1 Tax=Desulfovibrio desulfuricans TaxID=876 RepID=A0A4P7UP76_DESDE|nr:ABC transporter ATP-binding protein [Desulfovibrio desulfuricans]QCC86641.1 ATP-binding cassette domain-containing protein [Desulfovibrio desulfuricans]
MSCIQTRGLAYGQIVYNDLDIEGGRATFISGASGSGKSTLLRLFNKTLAPTAGTVLYNGQDTAGLDSIALRREVLLAGQSVFLFDGSVGDNFDAYCEARESAPLSAEDKQTFLRLCCANFPLDAPCVHLSGGERQRVFLAVCLSFLPRVLLLDEPTSALDQDTAERFMSQVLAYCRERGMTVVAVSHDPALTARHAQNIISLRAEAE